MKIAVLPFNAGPKTEPAFARQTANFVGEIVRKFSEHEISPVSYMGRTDEDGIPRFAHINPAETLNEQPMIDEFFEQSDVGKVVDGLLVETEAGAGELTVRWHGNGDGRSVRQKEYTYLPGGMLRAVREFVNDFAHEVGAQLPDELGTDTGLFGTEDAEAFRNFLIGYDATQYVERAQGMVLSSFDPAPAMDALAAAVEADPDWEGPYLTLIELCRLCTQYKLGNAEVIEASLKKLTGLEPDDARAWFALGNLYGALDDHESAGKAFEAAHAAQPDEPAILTRLGQAQIALGMPVNAERNFRKAVDLEGDDKPSMDLLSNVLAGTGRGHEIPQLWEKVVKASPQNAHARAKLALSMLAAGQKDDAMAEFEKAVQELDEPTVVKRYFASVLAKDEEYDRAMDLYEDVLDAAPADVQVLSEYAQTLSAAGRDFEVPKVLHDIIAANPDLNLKAMTTAWLLELEQPKRVEAVQAATKKAEQGDFKAALNELAPLKAWLADYWKLWAILATVYNNLDHPEDAEKAARQVLAMYPACEPAYGELCTALAGQGREKEAYETMKLAMANMPD
ncbi:MAG: tetratricopeptide repeat protein, partial [Armatimonadetes bacterium]|nr:tetratricopeptide repeat protein [Armatimonadota bacterium]